MKRILIVLLILGLSFMYGCGKKSGSSSSSSSSDLEITDIKVWDGRTQNIIATAKIVLNNSIAIEGVKLVDSKNGEFVAFPEKFNKKKNKYFPIIYVDRDFKDMVKKVIKDKKADGKAKGIEVTDVRVFKYSKEGSNLKGFASVEINGILTLKDMVVKEGSKGVYVDYPSRKSGDKYRDWYYPINKETRKKIQDAVLAKM